MMRYVLSLLVLGLCCSLLDAGPLQRRRSQQQQSSYSYSYQQSYQNGVYSSSESVQVTSSTGSALDEVNAKRAARGLRPFVHDPLLTEAAARCAAFRAQHRLFGHTSNDFAFLSGTSASAAGCAAYESSYGWMSCCTYDGYTYAGAAFVVGADGKRYMHLFVR